MYVPPFNEKARVLTTFVYTRIAEKNFTITALVFVDNLGDWLTNNALYIKLTSSRNMNEFERRILKHARLDKVNQNYDTFPVKN